MQVYYTTKKKKNQDKIVTLYIKVSFSTNVKNQDSYIDLFTKKQDIFFVIMNKFRC